MDRSSAPALYRKLYDYAFLPAAQYSEQRVRLRIWLHYMQFNRYQYGLLDELSSKTKREFADVERRQHEIIDQREPEVAAVYDELWAAMDRGATEAELSALAAKLDTVHVREAELLELRSRSVRALFDAQEPFLRSLTPQQEIWFSDAIFALRNRLDPYANPGDFNALVGSVYVAGEFGSLSRTTFDPNEDHLNIGGLWSENPEKLTGPYFQNARRDVILYMLLLEPAFGEALTAVESEKPSLVGAGGPGEPAGTTAPAVPGAPGGEGIPVAPDAGIPTPPAEVPKGPGIPEPPTPVKPAEPEPVKPDVVPPPG